MQNNVEQRSSTESVSSSVFCWDVLTSVLVVGVLILAFARFMPLSGDITQHFMLVDELTKYGGIRRPNPANLGLMALYPAGSHWIASVVGRVAGSSLIGITAVSIISLFLCYRFILKLVGEQFTGAMIVFVILFVLAVPTNSVIGWELYVNFFYPQLVADVVFFATLLWLARKQDGPTIVAVAAAVAFVAMWIQPLIALHLLGASLVLLLLEILLTWQNERRIPVGKWLPLVLLSLISGALVLFHPSLRAMQTISQHDGYLEFSYIHPTAVALLCALIGVCNLWVHCHKRTDYADRVIGAAVLASACLVVMQSLAMHALHLGSPYAIKKHLFLAFTLGMLNAARLICTLFNLRRRSHSVGWFIGPVLAGSLCIFVLRCFTTPVGPIVDAIESANTTSKNYAPGVVTMRDASLPPMINFMISQSSFQHPFDMTSISWMQGSDPAKGANLVMVPRDQVSEKCANASLPVHQYIVVKPTCLIENVVPPRE